MTHEAAVFRCGTSSVPPSSAAAAAYSVVLPQLALLATGAAASPNAVVAPSSALVVAAGCHHHSAFLVAFLPMAPSRPALVAFQASAWISVSSPAKAVAKAVVFHRRIDGPIVKMVGP